MSLDATTGYIGQCDHCASKTGEVYQPFPTCPECGDEVCATCVAPGAETDSDYDYDTGQGFYRWTTLCRRCARLVRVDELAVGDIVTLKSGRGAVERLSPVRDPRSGDVVAMLVAMQVVGADAVTAPVWPVEHVVEVER